MSDPLAFKTVVGVSPTPRPETRAGTTPIFKLNEDILIYVFLINSFSRLYIAPDLNVDAARSSFWDDKYPDAALVVNRRTSQVCRDWRQLIIGSSNIWANSLDFQLLDQQKDHWRNEVLRRTRSARLTIVGNFSSPVSGPNHVVGYLVALLRHHWDRIRSLTLVSSHETIEATICSLVHHPAPELEHFFFVNPTRTMQIPTFVPFANFSPRLHSLSWNAIAFQSTGSWLSNIRHLRLIQMSLSSAAFVALDVLQRLAEMQLLESLHFEGLMFPPVIAMHPYENLPAVLLPHLKKISVAGGIRSMARLVAHIRGVPGCRLDVGGEVMLGMDRQGITDAYSAYFSNHFKNCNIGEILLSISELELSIAEINIRIRGPAGNPGYFSFESIVTRRGTVDRVIYALADAVSTCNLNSVSKLILEISPAKWFQEASIDNMGPFCTGLSSAQQLITNEYTLDLILQSTLLPKLFPHLVSIHCRRWGDFLARYIEHRFEKGLPIKLVDLGEDPPLADRVDEHPAVIAGRRYGFFVSWGSKEYLSR